MTINLSYFVPPQVHVRARDRGLLDGLDIVESQTTGSEDQFESLGSGKLDVAVTAIDNLYEWVGRGAELTLVAQVEPHTPLVICAQPGIDNLAHLEGKTFGVDAIANGFALIARHVLKEANIEVKFVEIGGVRERFEALVDERIDATLLGPPLNELARAAGKVDLAHISEVLPDYPGQGLIARTSVVNNQEFRAYVDALRECGLLSVRAEGVKCLVTIRQSLGMSSSHVDLEKLITELI